MLQAAINWINATAINGVLDYNNKPPIEIAEKEPQQEEVLDYTMKSTNGVKHVD